VRGQDRAADGRGDHDHEHRAARGRHLLDDDAQLDEPATAAAVLLRQVDTEEARLAHLRPQLVGLAAASDDVLEVATPVPADEPGDALPEGSLFGGVVHEAVGGGHGCSYSGRERRQQYS
jgi:hypothetical protein